MPSIENPSKEQIEEYLAKIGWTVRHHGCEHYYFWNHKNKCTGLSLVFPKTDSRLHFEGKNYQTPSFTFYMKQIVMEDLGSPNGPTNCISFRGKTDDSIFILCQNFDRKRAKKS